MAETTAAPLLDLSTRRTRPIIRIDGVAHELRTGNDLSIFEYRHLERTAPQLSAMLLNQQPTPEEGQALSALLVDLCTRVLIAPGEVQTRLDDVQRMQIFTVFTHRLLPSPPASVGQGATTPAAGTRSSRASRGSSAVRRARGSKTRRSAPSART